jgi:hypothetical protein
MTKYFQPPRKIFTSNGDLDITATGLLQADAILNILYQLIWDITGSLKPSQTSLSTNLIEDLGA